MKFIYCVVVLISAAGIASAVRQEAHAAGELRPLADSPLAATQDALYAVEVGRKYILKRPADLSAPWRRLPISEPFDTIAGLTAAQNILYVTDSSDEFVYQIDLTTNNRTTLVSDNTMDDPGSVAIAGDVFVADNATQRIYRLRNGQRFDVLLSDVGDDRPLSLVGIGDDLYVATPNGRIIEYRGIGKATPDSQIPPGRQFGQPESDDALKRVIFRRPLRSSSIQEPSRISAWRGIIYIIDRGTKNVLAISRSDGSSVRIIARSNAKSASLLDPSSIAVNDRFVYVLSNGAVTKLPRVVPAQVKLRMANRSEVMTYMYSYMQRKNILPLREVDFDTDFETTLRKNQVLVAPDAYPTSWNALVCQWNPQHCKAGVLKTLQNHTKVKIPDLQLSSFVETTPVVLDGKSTLGNIVDQQVRSQQFLPWRSEERLQILNEPELLKANSFTARGVRTGTFLAPIEYLQYLIPTVAKDFVLQGELKQLEKSITGLRILSLEEGNASSLQAPLAPTPSLTLDALKTEFENMLKVVRYISPTQGPSPFPVRIGIAEELPVDIDNPDLEDSLLDSSLLAPADTAVRPAQPVTYQIRNPRPDLTDHATMVAAIVGARRSGFGHPGLAPRAKLVIIDGRESSIAKAIGDAAGNGVRLFNISAHFGPNHEPSVLLDTIQRNPQALFIVAAGAVLKGKEGQSICDTAYRVYPACWHNEKNVLVVTATSRIGDAVLGGMNFSESAVHLAAPGEGFHVAGFNRSYVPVHGTSFAAPIVTSAAALLSASNPVSPWYIKQRLIVTADPLLIGGEWLVGGRVNIEKALKNFGYSVLSRPDPQDPENKMEQELVALNQNPTITLSLPGGRRLELNVFDLRRVHKVAPGQYRIVYMKRDQRYLHPDPRNRDELAVIPKASFFGEKGDQFFALNQNGSRQLVELARWTDFVAPLEPM